MGAAILERGNNSLIWQKRDFVKFSFVLENLNTNHRIRVVHAYILAWSYMNLHEDVHIINNNCHTSIQNIKMIAK